MSQLTDWSFLPSFPPPQGATELEGVAWGRQWGSCCSGTEVACFPLSKPVCQAVHVPRRADSRWRLPRMTRRTLSWWSMLGYAAPSLFWKIVGFSFLYVITKQQKIKIMSFKYKSGISEFGRLEAGSLSVILPELLNESLSQNQNKMKQLILDFSSYLAIKLIGDNIHLEEMGPDTLFPGYWTLSMFSGFRSEVFWWVFGKLSTLLPWSGSGTPTGLAVCILSGKEV